MNKQKIFNTFIEKVNGRGRAFCDETRCNYVPENGHPGCAIGCQIPEGVLREKIRVWERQPTTEGTELMFLLEEYPEVKKVLQITCDKDIDFLAGMQMLHDNHNNWSGNSLKLEPLERFAQIHGISIPTLN